METVAPLDILRRAGVNCTSASASGKLEVLGRNKIVLTADKLLEDILDQTFDLVVIPGGPGVYPLRKDKRVIDLVRKQAEAGKTVAAICAAPTILKDAGLLEDKSYTGHFSIADELPDLQTASAVVMDGNIITSRGAGTAVEFGLTLAELLAGSNTSREVSESIHFQPA